MSVSRSIADEWEAGLRDAGVSDVADLLADDPASRRFSGTWTALTKPGLGARQRWRWELPADSEPGAVIYVKRYGRPSLKAQLDRITRQSPRHSRAWWEYQQARRLRAAYVPTPRLVAVAENMTGWLERRGVVLLTAVPGDAFDRVWREAARRRAPITRGLARHDMAVRLGRFVSAFHQTGACHRDLYLCHVFVELDMKGLQPPRFTLIDLARVLRPRFRRMRWIIKDLAQLDASAREIGASRTDRLRFLHAYLSLERGSPRVRWYARRILRKSNWIVRRIERKSRGR